MQAQDICGVVVRVSDETIQEAVRAVLTWIKKKFPVDFERIRLRIKYVTLVAKDEPGDMAWWEVNEERPAIDQAKDRCEWGYRVFAHDYWRFVGRGYIGIVVDDECDDTDYQALVAHELGHCATTLEDFEESGALGEEWAIESSANKYAFKWGFGKQYRRLLKRHERMVRHTGTLPGEILDINGTVYRMRDDFTMEKLT